MGSHSREKTLHGLLRRALDLEVDDVPAFLERVAIEHPELHDELRVRLTGEPESAVEKAVGQAVTAFAESLGPGTQLGRYRIELSIGEGGMGTVYLAAPDDATAGPVCIKVLKRGMDTDALLHRFQREREILASLDHPYIARLHEGGSTPDGRPYFVLEYVAGETIDRYCESCDLSIRQRLQLFLLVCEAVQFAHRRLIVHRDLKPANILVEVDGTPKLLDFGIAKLVDPDEVGFTTHLSGGPMLTPEYASPEQVRGERVTTASDVYSLCVLLYRLLTSRMPYAIECASRETIERIVCETEPARPSTHNRRLRGDLDAILETGLRKETDRRYGSVDELVLDIRRHLDGESIAARRSTALYRVRKFARRNPVLTALTVATIVLATAMSIQTLRVGNARDRTAAALHHAAAERDHAEGVAQLLAEVLQVSDTDITFLESTSSAVARFGTGSFAISAWIRPAGPSPGVRAILDKRVPPFLASRGFLLFTYDDRIGLQIAGAPADGSEPGGDDSANYTGRRNLVDGDWHHVVASVRRDPLAPSNNRIALYVDGAVDRTVLGGDVRRGSVDSDAALRVGHESDGFHVAYPFQGAIQSPLLFATDLDSSSVVALYEHGRRRRRPFVAHVPPVVASRDGRAVIPLVIGSRADEARTFVWSAGGRASLDDPTRVRLTRFDPTSGSVTVDPGDPWIVVPIDLSVPAGEHAAAFQVMVGSTSTGEQQTASGVLRAAGDGAPIPSTARPRVVGTGKALDVELRARTEVPRVARLASVDPISSYATLRFEGRRHGESIALPAGTQRLTVVGDPCGQSALHELVVTTMVASVGETVVEAHALRSSCGERAVAQPEWPAELPSPIDIDYRPRTRANAFISDTAVRFGISTPLRATLQIADLRGRIVRRMDLGQLAAGQHSIGWNGLDDAGEPVDPGLYAVRIYGDDYVVARWDEEHGRFTRNEPTGLIRTQVFRVRAHP